MGRSILGGIVGYIATFFALFIMLTAAFLILGTERSFEPGTFRVSMLWALVMILIGGVAAVIGGYVASLTGKGFMAVKVLAVIIAVMGLVSIIMSAMTPASTEVRAGDVSNMVAMGKAQSPVWLAVANAIVGVAGAVVGGRLRRG